MPPGEIAARTGIDPATLTGVFDRLEKSGRIERVADPAGRPRTMIHPIRSRVSECCVSSSR
jgi:DNA-binding MarR family transcriptional regulator